MANRNASPVNVPDEVKTGLKPQASPILSGADDAGKYFARIESSFSGLASAIGQVADTAAAVEGKQAGFQAGLDPEFRPTNGFSIRDRAFDASGVHTFLLKADTSIRQKADEIAQAYPNNPREADAAFKKLSDEWRGTFPEARAFLVPTIERQRLSVVRSATRGLDAQSRAENKVAFAENIVARTAALERSAYNLGLDDKADTTLAADVEEMRRELQAGIGRGDIAAGDGRRVLKQIGTQVTRARVFGAYDRMPDDEAKRNFVEGTMKGWASGEGPLKDLTLENVQELTRKLDLDQRRTLAAEAQAERAARAATVTQGYDMLRKGELTREWVEGNAETMSLSDYRRFNGVLQRRAANIDPAMLGSLLRRAVDDPGSALGEATDALAAGRIDGDGFKRISNLAVRSKAEREQQPWIADIRRSMLNQLQPSPRQSPHAGVRQLDGLSAFDGWLTANPKATPDEARLVAHGLADRYRNLSANEERATLPLPRYAPKGADNLGSEDLVRAFQELRKARTSGRMGEKEYLQEFDKMRAWKEFLDRSANGKVK